MDKMQGKTSRKIKKMLPIVGRIAFLLAILFLVAYLVSILTESKVFFRDSAERTALVRFEENLEKVDDLADEHYDNLYKIADKVKYATSQEDVEHILKDYIGKTEYGDLRFYAQGKAYDAQGKLVEKETSGNDTIFALAASNIQGCTEIYHDSPTGRDCIAFFVPVRGSAYVDGLLSMIPIRGEANTRPIFDIRDVLGKEDLAAILIDEKGNVYASVKAESMLETIGNDIYDFLSKMSTDPASKQALASAISQKTKGACGIEGIDGEYIFTLSPIEKLNGELYLVAMTEQEGLIAPEMRYMRYVIGLTVVAIVSLIIGAIYAVSYYKNSKFALEEAIYTDPIVGCANGERFRALVGKIMQDGQNNYAISVFELRQFRYLEETLSPDDMSEILKHTSKVISTFCHPRETYGYLGEGKFVLLILYHGDTSIRDRAKLISTVLSKHSVLGASKSKKIFNIGVGLAYDTKRYTVQELINHALIACESAHQNINSPFVVYNEEVNAEREHNDRIEMEMESALASGDFRLFLQPKYNVAADRIDSAEALVRWFDPKTGDYRFPGEFIGLFESNGFITKLDHFMYIEVLKYLQAAMERGEKQVPISVNVSLVTASESDFLNFYIENKKKYRIADDFITIEFTESFLAEDYQKIGEIVERLHRNGIRCSLDDFGTGYASFSVLKNIAFDELKLDRELLNPGFNPQQDDKVLSTILQLAKSLGMRVVQEGVETKNMFDKVVELGCEVIQGYYYAKAISVEEYKLFIGSNTSIKYKALLK